MMKYFDEFLKKGKSLKKLCSYSKNNTPQNFKNLIK